MKKFLMICALFMVYGHIRSAAHPVPAQEKTYFLINLESENVSVQTAVHESIRQQIQSRDYYSSSQTYTASHTSDILIIGTTFERRVAMLKKVCEYNDGISPVKAHMPIEYTGGMWQTFMNNLSDKELEDEAFGGVSKPDISIRFVFQGNGYPKETLQNCSKFSIDAKCFLMIPSTNQVSENDLKEYVNRVNVQEIIARAKKDRSKYKQLADMFTRWKFCKREVMPARSFRDALLDEEAPEPVQEFKSLTAVMWIEP